MDHESLPEDLSYDQSDQSIDSEIDHSFQSMMSITEDNADDQNIVESEDFIKNILEESEESEEKSESFSYPNEAYGDLMSLITKHKLNNATGNAIIKFFNKHANLDKSPLPKSTKQGRKFMDNMKISSLNYIKTCVINYNNLDYYLHYRSLINCIKNILLIPDILQNFVQNFKKFEVIVSVYVT